MKNRLQTRLHPLLVVAAISVIVFSVVGVAAMFGKIPGAESHPGEPHAQSAPAPAGDTYRASPAGSNALPAPAAQRSSGAIRAQAPAPCDNCGVIESIRTAQVSGRTSGVGAGAGAVVGGLLGNQVGRGDGRTIATIAGAAGGAYVGNTIEKKTNQHTVYRVTLRMEDGTQRTVTSREAPAYAVGERVRVANGRILERA